MHAIPAAIRTQASRTVGFDIHLVRTNIDLAAFATLRFEVTSITYVFATFAKRRRKHTENR